MEIQIIAAALTETLEEQKKTNQLLREQTQSIKELTEKVTAFNDKLDHIRIMAPPVPTELIDTVLSRGITRIEQLVTAQPKNYIRQLRILLFPEQNAYEYYRIVFGRLLLWLLGLSACAGLYCLTKEYIDKSSEESTRRYYYETYEKVLDQLDKTLDPASRKKMHDAMEKAKQQ
jgi:hypothetical protein